MGDANSNDVDHSSLEPTFQSIVSRKDKLFKIIVVGNPMVGKSSFIFRYVHGRFNARFKPTIGVDFALKKIERENNEIVRLQIWDIAGQERFGSLTRVYYRDAAACIIMFDVSEAQSFYDVAKWKQDVDKKVLLKDGNPVPCMLLGNKTDLSTRCIQDEEIKIFSKEHSFIGWTTMSVKENVNVDLPMIFLVEKLMADINNSRSPFPEDFTDSDGNIRLPEEDKTSRLPCC